MFCVCWVSIALSWNSLMDIETGWGNENIIYIMIPQFTALACLLMHAPFAENHKISCSQFECTLFWTEAHTRSVPHGLIKWANYYGNLTYIVISKMIPFNKTNHDKYCINLLIGTWTSSWARVQNMMHTLQNKYILVFTPHKFCIYP